MVHVQPEWPSPSLAILLVVGTFKFSTFRLLIGIQRMNLEPLFFHSLTLVEFNSSNQEVRDELHDLHHSLMKARLELVMVLSKDEDRGHQTSSFMY